jgi:hypothetical protein
MLCGPVTIVGAFFKGRVDEAFCKGTACLGDTIGFAAIGLMAAWALAIIYEPPNPYSRSIYLFIVSESTLSDNHAQLHHYVGPFNTLKIKDL